jgi:hypothetical protein
MTALLIRLGLALAIIVGISNRVQAEGSALADAMNDLRWGMNEYEVSLYLQSRLKSLYEARIKKASSGEKARLEGELKSRLRDIQRERVEFTGNSTRYDRGLIAYEFTHNNQESMMVVRDEKSTNYYFFINNSLWKWYKAYEQSAFRNKNFKQVSTAFEGKFGRGNRKEVERVPGAGPRPVIEWRDRHTRLRALDESETYGQYCLVFEDLALVGQIAGMRVNRDSRFAAIKPAKKKAEPERDTAQVEEAVSTKETAAAKNSKTKKSVFDQEKRDETDAEYEARKQRIVDQQNAANRKKFEKKVAEKRAKVLESLKGLEENDPLSGL